MKPNRMALAGKGFEVVPDVAGGLFVAVDRHGKMRPAQLLDIGGKAVLESGFNPADVIQQRINLDTFLPIDDRDSTGASRRIAPDVNVYLKQPSGGPDILVEEDSRIVEYQPRRISTR